jgi:hypothetical protein
MLTQLKEANPAGAVVGQIINDVTPQIWSLVDLPKVRKSATLALNYEVQVRYQGSSTSTPTHQTAFSDLDSTLEARVKELFEPDEQIGALTTAKNILTQMLERKSNTSTLTDTLTGEKS